MKKKRHLTREQRYQISALLQAGHSQKEIAEVIGKDKSVISRELKRNGDKHIRPVWPRRRSRTGAAREVPQVHGGPSGGSGTAAATGAVFA